MPKVALTLQIDALQHASPIAALARPFAQKNADTSLSRSLPQWNLARMGVFSSQESKCGDKRMTCKTRAARLKRLGLGAVAAGLLALLPTSSFAAPIGGAKGLQAPSSVAKVDYRCWWSYGERHCAWFNAPGPRVYGYYFAPYGYYRSRPARPEDFRTGSHRWWNSMERWGRTGSQQ